MTELFTVVPPSEAFRTFLRALAPLKETETIQVRFAAGRVAAGDLPAPAALPGFSRSTMDGYAVRSADTIGASESAPAYLRLVGEVRMGTVPDRRLQPGEALRIHTGAMLPPGADGVVMIEETTLSGEEVEVLASIAPGENVFGAEEDAAPGETVVTAGKRLRPADLGPLDRRRDRPAGDGPPARPDPGRQCANDLDDRRGGRGERAGAWDRPG